MKSDTNLRNFEHAHLELDQNKILFAPDPDGVIQYEEWRDIPEWEGLYQVSSFGRVRSLDSVRPFKDKLKNYKGRILKQSNQRYRTVNLCSKKQKLYYTHQLVGMAFLGHKPCGHNIVIDHKDNIKTNNFLWNLHLVTHRYNSTKTQDNRTSKYAGVSWANHANKWRVNIMFEGKTIRLGYFESEYEAHLVYQKALKHIENGEGYKVQKRKDSSIYKGVTFVKKRNKWKAQIGINGKSKFIGEYKTEYEAHLAYQEKLKSLG